MSENLTSERNDRLQRLTLVRTAKRNALSGALCRELLSEIQAADADRTVGAILLTGEGKAFCAGMDLEETLQADAANVTAIHEQLFTIGTRLHKPLIAAVQGAAYGGGVGLVANAHIAIAADDIQFGLTEIRLAMWPYVVQRSLVRAMGNRRTLELSLTARLFSATEALSYGLVHSVLPRTEFTTAAEDLAQQIAESSADGLRRGLAFTSATESLPASEAGQLALAHRTNAFQSDDFREGVRAFQEKRPPRWPSNG